MAFRTGSPIRPELGKIDYSPIMQGGAMWGQGVGQGLQAIGAGIGKALEQKKADKDAINKGLAALNWAKSIAPSEQALAAIEGEIEFLKDDNNTRSDRAARAAIAANAGATIFAEGLKMQQQKATEAAQGADLNAAISALQNAFPATETGENKFDPNTYLQAYSQAGGKDIGTALKVLDYSVKSGDIKLPEKPMSPQEEAELAKTRAEAEKLTAEAGDIKAKAGQAKPNQFRESMDRNYAVQAAEWNTIGRPQAIQNLTQIKDVVSGLKQGRIETRSLIDYLPFVSEGARAAFAPSTSAAIDQIRMVAYQSLRDTLGAQFTEREGERLVSTYFNPKLGETENIRRLNSLTQKLETAFNAKESLFKHMAEFGTSEGYEGPTPEQIIMEAMGGDGSSYVTAGGLKVEVIEE